MERNNMAETLLYFIQLLLMAGCIAIWSKQQQQQPKTDNKSKITTNSRKQFTNNDYGSFHFIQLRKKIQKKNHRWISHYSLIMANERERASIRKLIKNRDGKNIRTASAAKKKALRTPLRYRVWANCCSECTWHAATRWTVVSRRIGNFAPIHLLQIQHFDFAQSTHHAGMLSSLLRKQNQTPSIPSYTNTLADHEKC